MWSRGSFQQEVACCLCIKWWAAVLSAAFMRKWPEYCNSQPSNSFYHLSQMFKGTGVARRSLLGKDGGLGSKVEGVYKKKMVLIERGSDTNIKRKSNKKNIERRE